MRWTEKEIQMLREEYPENGYCIDQLNRTKSAIQRKASRLGIKTNYKPGEKNIKEANRDFFSEIDSEGKAYWLGFILADGNVHKGTSGGYYFQINIGKKDRSHLEKFKTDIESEHKISEKKNGKVSIYISGGNLCSDLMRHGVVPRKSSKVNPQEADVPKHLRRHFWRGMVDGDGGVYIHNNENEEKVGIALAGTRKTCKHFKKYIINEIRVNTDASIGRIEDTYIFRISGNESPTKVIKYVYDESSVSLDRKQETADKIIKGDWREHDYIKKPWTSREIEILKEKYPKHGSSIQELERSRDSIWQKASRLGIQYVQENE